MELFVSPGGTGGGNAKNRPLDQSVPWTGPLPKFCGGPVEVGKVEKVRTNRCVQEPDPWVIEEERNRPPIRYSLHRIVVPDAAKGCLVVVSPKRKHSKNDIVAG